MMEERRMVIADTLGVEENLCQLAEECAELTQAALKYRRSMRGLTPVPEDQAVMHMIEEIADVEICIEQMMYLLDCNGDTDYRSVVDVIKEAKTERWFKRTFPNGTQVW